jgi:hypothetical protein
MPSSAAADPVLAAESADHVRPFVPMSRSSLGVRAIVSPRPEVAIQWRNKPRLSE